MTYKCDHVDHRGIAGYKQQKRDLNSVWLFNVTLFKLLDNQFADQIIFWLLDSLIDQATNVAKKLSGGDLVF